MDELAGTIFSEIVKGAFNLLRESLNNHGQETENLRSHLESHIKEIVSWSGRVQFFGMAQAFNTDNSTIKINLSTIPRKFRGEKKKSKIIDEHTLFKDRTHYILLGSPGSGKTTTFKRLARTLIFSEPSHKDDIYQFPIVVRLKDLAEGHDFNKYIAELLGISVWEKKPTFEESRDKAEFFIGEYKLNDCLPKILRLPLIIAFLGHKLKTIVIAVSNLKLKAGLFQC